MHLTNESNVHLISRLIFLESKVVFLSSLTRQLQSQNRQLKLVVSALTLRSPLNKEQRLTSLSSSPTKPCPPPSAWLSPGRVQAHHKHDAGVEDHMQALLFSGSCTGSFSTDEMPVPDRSDGIAPAAAQPYLPDVSSARTSSPVPPPNTPMTEAATAPRLTPMRIQLLDQLLDLEEGEEEHGDSESGGQGAVLHMYSNPMFSSSGGWGAVISAAKEDAKSVPSKEMETEAPLLQTPQLMTPTDDPHIQPGLHAQESTSPHPLPRQAVPSQEPQPPQPEAAEMAAEAITQEETPPSTSSSSAAAAAPPPPPPGRGSALLPDALNSECTPLILLLSHPELDQEPAAAVAATVSQPPAEYQAPIIRQQHLTHQPPLPSDPEAHQVPAPAAPTAAAAAEMSKPPAEHQAALAPSLHSNPDQEAEASAAEALLLDRVPHPPNQAQSYAEDASPAGTETAAVGTRTAAADTEIEIAAAGTGTAAGTAAAPAASLPAPQPTTRAQVGAEGAPPAGTRVPPAVTGTAAGDTRTAASLPAPMPPSSAVATATAAATALISATWARILRGSVAVQGLAQGPPSKPASHWIHSEHSLAARRPGSLGEDGWPSHSSDETYHPANIPDSVQARVQTAGNIEGSRGSTDTLGALPRAAMEPRGLEQGELQTRAFSEHSNQAQQHQDPQSGALSERRACSPELAEGAADSVQGSVLGSIYSRLKATHGHALPQVSEGESTAWQQPVRQEQQPKQGRAPHVSSVSAPPGKSSQDLGYTSALEVALSLKPLYPDHAKPNLLQTSPPASTNSWQSQSPAPTKHSRHKLPNTPLQASPTSPTASAAAQHAHSPQESSRNTRSSLPPRPPAQPTRGQEAAAVRELDFISSDARSNNSGRGAAALRPNLISSDAHSSSSSSRKSAAVQRPGSSPDTRTRAGSSRAYSAAVRPQVASNSSSNKQNSRSFSAPRASMADTGNSLAPEKAETGELALYRKRSKQPKAGLGCHIQPSLQLPELEGMLQQDGEGQQMSAQEGQEQHQQQQNGPSLPPQSSLHRNAHRPLHHKSRIPRPPSSGSSSTQQLAIPRHPSGSPCRLAQPAILTLPADAGSLCSLSRWESTDDLEGPAPGAWRLESQRNSDPDIMAWLQSSLAM